MVQKFHNYDKYPVKRIQGYKAYEGYEEITEALKAAVENIRKVQGAARVCIVLEAYTQVDVQEILDGFSSLNPVCFPAEDCMVSKEKYEAAISGYLTSDRVFGIMNTLNVKDFYVEEKMEAMRKSVQNTKGLVLVYGVGASLICRGDLLVYADLARWEIQKRFAMGEPNWRTHNEDVPKLSKFKQGYFVEWRMADRIKKPLLSRLDFLLDTNEKGCPRMVSGDGFRAGLDLFSKEPFRLVPYFAPEVWGGQWMKEICGLDQEAPNYAWAFDGVPEENSIFMQFGNVRIEVPSVNVVFYHPGKLLGERVHARFGDEYPIRFDFLDTFGGQNLSLQVHPLTEYIQSVFGMHYTQDESYYILDCEEDCKVYLGLKENVDRDEMLRDLKRAQRGEISFDAEKYVNTWPVRPHDHFLIPAGTIHCSGKDTMVLEISATPYIFTFKLWDWGRLGLDGMPRPVHIQHGEQNIQWDRTTGWVKDHLVNQTKLLSDNEGFRAERTGLHEREFIDTVRYHVTEVCELDGKGSVSTCNVVGGRGAVIESVDESFADYEVHYGETFIIPASVARFRIRPLEDEVMILRATVK